ncbi:MAG: CHAT domain-containing protein [Bacteroidia bacterium]
MKKIFFVSSVFKVAVSFLSLFLTALFVFGQQSTCVEKLEIARELYKNQEINKAKDACIKITETCTSIDSVNLRAHLIIANSYLQKRDLAEAIEWFKKADSNSFPNEPVSIDFNLSYALAFFMNQELENCEKRLHKTIELAKAVTGEKSMKVAELYNNLSVVAAEQGHFDEEVEYLEIAKLILIDNGKGESPEMATVLNNLGVRYNRLGKYNEGKKVYEKCIAIRENQIPIDSIDLGRAYYHLGMAYYDLNQLSLAELYISKALKMHKEVQKESAELYHDYNVLGMIARGRKQYSKALEFQTNAIEMATKTFGEYSQEKALSYGNMGRIYRDLKLQKKELNCYKSGLENILRAGAFHPQTVWHLSNIAGYYLDDSKTDSAFKYLYAAKHYYSNKIVGDSLSQTKLYNLLAEAHEMNKQYDSVLYYSLSVFGFKTNEFQKLGQEIESRYFVKEELEALSFVSKAILASSNNSRLEQDLALMLLQKGIKATNTHASYTNTTEGKFRVFDEFDKLYKLGISTAIELYLSTNESTYFEIALNLNDQYNTSLLRESFSKSSLLEGVYKDDSLINLEHHLGLELDFLINQLPSSKGQEKKNTSKKIEKISKNLEQISEQIKTEHPNYYNYLLNNTNFKLGELQEKICSACILQSYFTHDDITYIFSITQKEIKIESFNNVGFEKQVQEIIEMVTNIPTLEFNSESYNSKVNAISKHLLPKSDFNTLLVNPSGVLNYLPFDILFEDEKPIALTKNVGFLNSLAVWLNTSKNNQVEKAIAIAPEYQDEFSINNKEEAIRIKKESQLEFEMLDNTVIADYSLLKKLAIYDLIHFASHALLNDSFPEKSHLLFSNQSSIAIDQIFATPFNANSIFLSACETAAGQKRNGIGLFSLANAFFYSGCHSVTMNHWRADDNSSVFIAGNYYKYLNDGFNKIEALSQAKRDFLNTSDQLHQHPYYWANTIHVGNFDPVNFKSKSNRSFLWVVSILLLMVVSIVGFRALKK